jgi:hypothetical protein
MTFTFEATGNEFTIAGLVEKDLTSELSEVFFSIALR